MVLKIEAFDVPYASRDAAHHAHGHGNGALVANRSCVSCAEAVW
jgi:hypothetical protein